MKLVPHGYQEAAIQKALDEPTHGVLIGDEMGRGKTLTATEIMLRAAFERVLIIGIKDTFAQWAERIAEQSEGHVELRRIYGEKKEGRQAFADFLAGKPGFYFSGSEYLRAQDWTMIPEFNDDGSAKWKVEKDGSLVLKENPGIGPRLLPVREMRSKQLGIFRKMTPVDCILVDEVHVFSNRKANGRKTLVSIPTDWKIGMSGTWAGNNAENMWSITRWIWGALIEPNFYTWRRTWCATEEVYLSRTKTTSKTTGEKVPGAFAATLPCYIRNEAEEHAPEPEIVYVDLSPTQRAQYDELEADLVTWLDSHQGAAPLIADLPIVLRSRLRTATLGEMSFSVDGEIQFTDQCESSKLRALRGVLDAWGGQKAIVFTDSKRFAKVTARRMRAAGYRAEEWTGDTSSKQRDDIKARFTAEGGDVDYIIAVIPALSTGYDGLQRVCNRMVWLSESESQLQNEQARARLFRPGRTLANGGFRECKILARDTHDVGIYSSLVQQRFMMTRTLRAAA